MPLFYRIGGNIVGYPKTMGFAKGKTVLVTGSTGGIGKETAKQLAERGARVIVHGRTEEKGRRAWEEIAKASGANALDFVWADFSSLAQVRSMAEQVRSKTDRLEILINNAGVYLKNRRVTEDGYEETFAVSHLAHFLLTNLLLDLLRNSAPSRIINVSSTMHRSGNIDLDDLQKEKGYDGMQAYSDAKLANLLFTRELAKRLEGSGVTVNALHPGGVSTKLLHAGFGGGGISVEEGAESPVYLADAEELGDVTGRYFSRKREAAYHRSGDDDALRRRFWEVSERLTNLG